MEIAVGDGICSRLNHVLTVSAASASTCSEQHTVTNFYGEKYDQKRIERKHVQDAVPRGVPQSGRDAGAGGTF
jgi:hypothetical protein